MEPIVIKSPNLPGVYYLEDGYPCTKDGLPIILTYNPVGVTTDRTGIMKFRCTPPWHKRMKWRALRRLRRIFLP